MTNITITPTAATTTRTAGL